MKLTIEKLESQLRGALAPAYLVSGDEPLLLAEAADAIRARARANGYTDRETYSAERGMDWAALRNSAATLSLFADKRIIEIRLPGAKPGVEGADAILELLRSGGGDRLLLLLTGKLDKATQTAAWVRAIEEHGVWLPVWPVGADRLAGWMAQRCRKVGFEASAEALEILVERTEGNLLAANQEIAKLRLLVTGAQLGAAEVLASVTDSSRFDVFKLGEAALAGDAPRALRILTGLRGEGVEPTLVLWSLLRELRTLWGAHRKSGAGPSRPAWGTRAAALQTALGRAARFPFARLVGRAARADRMIKGRLAGDPWDELLLLTAEFCGRRVLAPVAQRRN